MHGQPQLKAETWCTLADYALWSQQYKLGEQLYKKALALYAEEQSPEGRCTRAAWLLSAGSVTEQLQEVFSHLMQLLGAYEPPRIAIRARRLPAAHLLVCTGRRQPQPGSLWQPTAFTTDPNSDLHLTAELTVRAGRL